MRFNPEDGCGTTMGHGESCCKGHLCDACLALSGQIPLYRVRVPCGKTTGHGEACCEARPCDNCARIMRASR